MTMPIAELPAEIVELMPDGPYLSANERYLRFIIYSLAEQNIQEPFRVMTRGALNNNATETDIHNHFLTVHNRMKLQAMVKNDLSGLESYFVFAQCERYMNPTNAHADADQMNRVYQAALCE